MFTIIVIYLLVGLALSSKVNYDVNQENLSLDEFLDNLNLTESTYNRLKGRPNLVRFYLFLSYFNMTIFWPIYLFRIFFSENNDEEDNNSNTGLEV
jgi:hypothetical protein